MFNTKLNSAAVTLTTTLTARVAEDCELDGLVFCNTTGGAITVSVADANGKYLLNGMSIPANSTQQIPFDPPQYMAGGVKWLASGNTSIDAHIMGRVKR